MSDGKCKIKYGNKRFTYFCNVKYEKSKSFKNICNAKYYFKISFYRNTFNYIIYYKLQYIKLYI